MTLFVVAGVGIIGTIGIFSASIYNDLVIAKNRVKNSWANIDAQIQRRFDLVPNLAETVKGYAEHEKHLLKNVENIISEYKTANTKEAKLNIDTQLNILLNSLYVVANNYPLLKSNIQFIKLQNSLAEIEEDITYARQFYNDAVTIYNNKLMSFPNNVIASKFNFKEEPLFDAFSGNEKVPRIHFKTKCPVCGATIEENSTNCQYCGCNL